MAAQKQDHEGVNIFVSPLIDLQAQETSSKRKHDQPINYTDKRNHTLLAFRRNTGLRILPVDLDVKQLNRNYVRLTHYEISRKWRTVRELEFIRSTNDRHERCKFAPHLRPCEVFHRRFFLWKTSSSRIVSTVSWFWWQFNTFCTVSKRLCCMISVILQFGKVFFIPLSSLRQHKQRGNLRAR